MQVQPVKAAGAKRALPLPVSVPSHCALMKPAADKLAVELEKITFNAPTISVVNNVDVKCETTPEAIRDALVRQLYSRYSGPKPLSLWPLRALSTCTKSAQESPDWSDKTYC